MSVRKAKLALTEKTLMRRKLSDLRRSLSEFLSGSRLEFVMSQLRSATRKSKGLRWTPKDKALALSLLHASPKCYRLFRKMFSMPSIQTLKRAIHNIHIYPGFNKSILDALRMKTSSLPPASKIVVIAMDEMSIKEGLSYDKGRDIIEGFVDGVETTKELANHAVVFMARGLMEKWKQPVAYYLASGPMKGRDMKILLMKCIHKLKEIGLTPMLFVSDQGSNNRNMLQTEMGVTKKKPFFYHEDTKIFAMYDPPHLVKNIRNNLRNHGFTIEDNDILWSHVVEFYEKDCSKSVRMAPRLTKKHIFPVPFSDLRVNLAAQVLSHSVASGMAVMAEWNIIPEEAEHTAKFISHMDKLFNAFNSKSVNSTAPMRHAMSESSGHKEFLVESLAWIKSIKTKGSRRPDCLHGWEMSIACLLQLWDTLQRDHGVKFLLTNRLNQDCVENLFCVIRAKGAQRDNPDAAQFRLAFRQVMVDSVMTPTRNSNCVEDVDSFLLTLGTLEKNPDIQPIPVPQSAYYKLLQQLPASVHSILDVCTIFPEEDKEQSKQEINVLAYIGGYIIRKIREKVCESCVTALSSVISPENVYHDFIRTKKHKNARDGLIAPSDLFIDMLSKMEAEFTKIIDDAMHVDGIKAYCIAALGKCLPPDHIKCDFCKCDTLIVHIMVNVRLHHALRESNRSLASMDKRKNRKILKFSHL